jgi:hypothetical protein
MARTLLLASVDGAAIELPKNEVARERYVSGHSVARVFDSKGKPTIETREGVLNGHHSVSIPAKETNERTGTLSARALYFRLLRVAQFTHDATLRDGLCAHGARQQARG